MALKPCAATCAGLSYISPGNQDGAAVSVYMGKSSLSYPVKKTQSDSKYRTAAQGFSPLAMRSGTPSGPALSSRTSPESASVKR